MRRFSLLAACAAVALLGVTPGFASSAASNKDAGKESAELFDATDWFTLQRLAPNGAVNPNAYAAAAIQANALSSVGGAWTERTNLAGADGNDFSDSPQYIDPTSNF